MIGRFGLEEILHSTALKKGCQDLGKTTTTSDLLALLERHNNTAPSIVRLKTDGSNGQCLWTDMFGI